ncbi:hypothetical protein J4558_19835 [Leptolyngbya sp. 15MV]|nr:hypothetical protein J4558_19835 [Leptolyngbya sp. 15MV]
MGRMVPGGPWAPLGAVLPQVREGRLRALAVSTRARARQLPDVPTVAESLRLAEFDTPNWIGLLVPAGTPEGAVARLSAAANLVLAQDTARARLDELGFRPLGGTPEAFAQLLRSSVQAWAETVRAANIRID